MRRMGPGEQGNFFEADEDAQAVAEAFEQGPKGVTTRLAARDGDVFHTRYAVVSVRYNAGEADTQRRGPGAHLNSSPNVREFAPA